MAETVKKIRWSTLGYVFLTFLLLMLVVSLVVTYFAPRNIPVIRSFVTQAPFPVVLVGYGEMVSFRKLSQNMEAVQRFYENQDFSLVGLRVDFSTDEGRKRLQVREKEVLNKMLEDIVVKRLAKERGIRIDPEMARHGLFRKIEEYGNDQEVRENLMRLYGWNLVDFEEKVVVPSLYEEKLNESYLKETDPISAAKKKIESAAELLRQGTAFEDAAREHSEGQTALRGGELGWFALSDLAPELRSPVALQKVGVPGNIIESGLGFHIILVDEVKEEKAGQMYRIKQIFARKDTFADWLSAEMKEMSILVLDPLYRFDAETARIEFRAVEWQRYEQELIEKAGDDASFFF